MTTDLEINDDKGDLDRAVAALRDTPIPSGPSSAIQSATVAALSQGESRRIPWPSINAPVLARAAVLACLAAGAAAAYFTLIRHNHDYSSGRPRTPVLPATPAIASAGGSMITGEIRFEGIAPPPRLIDFPAAGDPAGEPVHDDSLLVNLDDTLQNVVISVVAGLPEGRKYPEPAARVYLDQAKWSFQPHVLAMRTGQPIFLRNLDPVAHDADFLSLRNKRFNITERAFDAGELIPSPTEAEIFPVQCDVHPWMKAWLCAFNHPYFNVSLTNGTFTLQGLPPGHYRLQAWQERLGTIERDVTVEPGRDETVNFIYRVPATPSSPRANVPENLASAAGA